MKSGQELEVQVSIRNPGKHHSRLLRRTKRVPGVVYGAKIKPFSVEADEKLIERCRKMTLHENPIFKLVSDQSELNHVNVMVKSIDIHPLNRRPVHIDFFALDMTAQIRVNVQLKFEGRPRGLADGGNLQVIMREVEVECLPTQIPEALVANVEGLGVSESLHVYDLQLPEGVRMMSDKDLAIATVAVIEEEVITPVVSEAATADGAAAAAPGAPAAAGAAAPGAAGATPAAAGGGAKKS
jgi:large subunit ribosomal protein L25